MQHLCSLATDESQPMQRRMEALSSMRELVTDRSRSMAARCMLELVRSIDAPPQLQARARACIASMCVVCGVWWRPDLSTPSSANAPHSPSVARARGVVVRWEKCCKSGNTTTFGNSRCKIICYAYLIYYVLRTT